MTSLGFELVPIYANLLTMLTFVESGHCDAPAALE